MKKILSLIVIILSINNLFSLEIRTSKMIGGYKRQAFSTYSVQDIFYTNDNELILKALDFEKQRFFLLDYNNEISEIDELKFNAYKQKQLEYDSKLRYGYELCISKELIAFDITSRPMKGAGSNIQYIDDACFLYIKNIANEIIFNFNQWKINHEEFFPEATVNSLGERIYFTEEKRIREMQLNAAYTLNNKNYINSSKNRIAIVLEDSIPRMNGCLIIFDVLYNATVNDFRVRLRNEPNLNCETLSYFYPGDKVKILDQTDEPYEIDGESWYWYKVESGTYPVGWVYGKYLDIEK